MEVARSYSEWFQDLLGFAPYDWQRRVGERDCPGTLLIRIPTGLGKTEGVLAAWLYHVAEKGSTRWPRRLVWCLPMRVLVEQTVTRAKRLVERWARTRQVECPPRVYTLMGGVGRDETTDWDLEPEQPAILVGTQDMLLSRALNRGYGASRYRWPIQFGLLHNDCLWVFDEVQLMDVGVPTSAQLEAFRRHFGTMLPSYCIWMSATLDPRWLQTVDTNATWFSDAIELEQADLKVASARDRYLARKRVERARTTMDDPASAAEEILGKHEAGTLTLAIVNTVERASELYRHLKRRAKGREGSPDLLLLHSRYRAPEKQSLLDRLLSPVPVSGRIAVSTQVVEAGVDLSAKRLFTDLAPWASLVQRFGRCNRAGEHNAAGGGHIYWFDLPEDGSERQKVVAPYKLEDLETARRALERLDDGSPERLNCCKVPMALDALHVLRRRDFVDLFDTTPDLAGNDLDVSRFIRAGLDNDVLVFWRDIPPNEEAPDPKSPEGRWPHRDELCAVPVHEFQAFVKKQKHAWVWDPLHDRWRRPDPDTVYAGQVYLVASSAGGYDPEFGWNPKSRSEVAVTVVGPHPPEGYDRDEESKAATWQDLAEHTDAVCASLESLVRALGLGDPWRRLLHIAARWHDYGKVHQVFQSALPDGKPAEGFWAKAPGTFKRYERPHFRHELASALAVLQRPHVSLQELSDDELQLVAYLVAAHHGKVRLSIRSLPGETAPQKDGSQLYARGVWDGDELARADLGGGVQAGPVQLSLEPMLLGSDRSWIDRTARLRDDPSVGPLRLAFLEALLRIADMRASRAPKPASTSGEPTAAEVT